MVFPKHNNFVKFFQVVISFSYIRVFIRKPIILAPPFNSQPRTSHYIFFLFFLGVGRPKETPLYISSTKKNLQGEVLCVQVEMPQTLVSTLCI